MPLCHAIVPPFLKTTTKTEFDDDDDEFDDSASNVSPPEMIDDSSQSESSESREFAVVVEKTGSANANANANAAKKSILRRNPRYSSDAPSSSPSFASPPLEKIDANAILLEPGRLLPYPPVAAATTTKRRIARAHHPRRNNTSSLQQLRQQRRRRRRRARFADETESPVSSTARIPSRDCYGRSERLAMWSSPTALEANAIRNRAEYAFDGWKMENATEEEGMYYHPATGNHIHPVHFCRRRHRQQAQAQRQRQRNNELLRLEELRRRQQHFLAQEQQQQQQRQQQQQQQQQQTVG